MRQLVATVLTCLALGLPVRADGDRAGEFDYYVLSLSWSPTWCALEGRARQSPQCDESRDFGWVLHGLWPQYERGYPANCQSAVRNPPRSMTAGMADIMGAPGAAWYQWKKHGRCSGLEAGDYFALARLAYESVNRPQIFRDMRRDLRLPARVVKEAFLESNPKLRRDMITITCKAGRIQEARVCLTRDLDPRDCGTDVVRDCSAQDALMDAID